MSDTIFNADPATEPKAPDATAPTNPEVTTTPVTSPDPYTDILKGITDDGRQKYGTVSDALNSIPAKETHISNLEKELSEMRAKLEQSTSVDAVLNKLNEQQTTDQSNGVDESTVLELVNQALSTNKAKESADSNITTVTTKMTEMFGDDAEKVFYDKAKELGVSAEFLNTMSAKSPKAVLSYFPETKQTVTRTTTGVNTAAFNTTGTDTPKTNIMGGASSSEIVALWKASLPTD